MNKDRLLKFLAVVFVAVFLCVLALRSVYTDSAEALTNIALFDVFSPVKSLVLTMVLLFAILAAYAVGIFSGKFKYRYTGIEIGLALFVVGGFFAIGMASDVRNAITMFFTLAVPVAGAVVLSQILDRRLIYLCVAVLVGLGCVNFVHCVGQQVEGNRILIEEYEQNPKEQLGRLGIEEGTLEQFLYEHRLMSKDIKGYFTTGNSAGSFILLGLFAAVGLLFDAIKKKNTVEITIKCLIAVVLAAGVVMTKSNGARVGLLAAVVLFVVYSIFGKKLWKYRTAILCLVVLAVVLAVGFVVWYGNENGTLPGGNAMFVRWGYWTSSWDMFCDNLFGVGGGNFGEFYPRYKDAGAIETIRDPHNFVLSLLCQYGIVGAVGVFVAILAVMIKSVYCKEITLKEEESGKSFSLSLVSITFVIFFGRWVLVRISLAGGVDVAVYLMLVLYILPAAVFVISTFLISKAGDGFGEMNFLKAGLWCGLGGFLVHNLIDFAIFEPGLWCGLWLVLGCLAAMNEYKAEVKANKFSKVLVVPASVLLFGLFVWFVFVPVAKSAVETNRAYRIFGNAMRSDRLEWVRKDKFFKVGEFEKAEGWLNAASESDKFSDVALSLKVKMFLAGYEAEIGGEEFLEKAYEASLKAARRNRKDFKHYETAMRACIKRANIGEKEEWLGRAVVNGFKAVELYPGKGELWFELGRIYEGLGRKEEAEEFYGEAVRIEEAFVGQFKKMYADREVVSRLGAEKYREAKEKSESN